MKKAQITIAKLKRKDILDLRFVEVDKEDDIIDLIGQPLKDKGNAISDGSKKRTSRKRRH